MLDPHFVLLGAACSMAGVVVYARDTVRGVTHPNRVTWFLWGAIPMITFAAEIQEGVGFRSIMTLSIGLGPFVVLVASLWNRTSVWKISTLDYVCGGLSVAGLGVWLVTQKGTVAIIASIAADALAAIPTIHKGWVAPESETAAAYLGGTASAVITLLTITTVTTGVLAFPLYIALISALELSLVAGRIGPRLKSRMAVKSPV